MRSATGGGHGHNFRSGWWQGLQALASVHRSRKANSRQSASPAARSNLSVDHPLLKLHSVVGSATRIYREEMPQVSLDAVNQVFDLYSAGHIRPLIHSVLDSPRARRIRLLMKLSSGAKSSSESNSCGCALCRRVAAASAEGTEVQSNLHQYDIRRMVRTELRRKVAAPVSASDVRRRPIAVYHPNAPPRLSRGAITR